MFENRMVPIIIPIVASKGEKRSQGHGFVIGDILIVPFERPAMFTIIKGPEVATLTQTRSVNWPTGSDA